MYDQYFYHSILENSIRIFGKLFSSIKYKKGEELFSVPIVYSAKDKIISKIDQYIANDLQFDINITLPRMGFLMGDPQIDKTKQLNRLHKIYPLDSKDSRKHSFNSVPYIVPFYLSILTKTSKEMFQIVEQILPFFSPELSITIKDIPELELKTDYIYKIDSITQDQNTWDGNFEDRRLIVWTIAFSCELNLYYPIVDSKIIKKIILEGFEDKEQLSDLFNYSTEVIPFEATPRDVHVLKDIWQEGDKQPPINFLTEYYDVFVSNFNNVLLNNFENQNEMDTIWVMIQDLLGIINSDKQISAIVSNKQISRLSSIIKTTSENSLFSFFIPLRDQNSFFCRVKDNSSSFVFYIKYQTSYSSSFTSSINCI